MDKAQKAVAISLICTSALAWAGSIEQPDMFGAMTSYNPFAISLFTASWTAGMAAMMFPAITPMVMLYNRFVSAREGSAGSSVTIHEGSQKPSSVRVIRLTIFVGCYLLVWAATGVALLLGWSVVMNNTIMKPESAQFLPIVFGVLLVAAGVYQFTPIKKTCIGYCESPMSFFMRRWKDGTGGAAKMGVWHGAYCLGCCWPYFLLMVALGWMSLMWMGLFAGVIFGEKMWRKGIWVARTAGAGLAITGILVAAGLLPGLAPSMSDTGAGMEMIGAEDAGEAATPPYAGDDGSHASDMQDQPTSAPDNQMSDMKMQK